MPDIPNNPFFNYLQKVGLKNTAKEEVADFKLNMEDHSSPKESTTLSYILDYRTGKYFYFCNKAIQLTGFDQEAFLKGGINFTIQQHNQQDAEIFTNSIFPKRLKFLQKLDLSNHPDYHFQHSFRFQHKDQHFVTILQESMLLKWDKNGPLVVMEFWTDITPFKDDNFITDVIKYCKPGEPQQVIEQSQYYPKLTEGNLSVREMEILTLITKGYSSEEIAQKLHISKHTVLTHRAHIREKTKAKNVADLLRYANSHKILSTSFLG